LGRAAAERVREITEKTLDVFTRNYRVALYEIFYDEAAKKRVADNQKVRYRMAFIFHTENFARERRIRTIEVPAFLAAVNITYSATHKKGSRLRSTRTHERTLI
jgi:hypothetical protein